jgi:hypothetical protein
LPDYYETLGVGVDASPQVIQRVYRQLARAYHPDTNPDNPAGAEKLKQLSEAYETLKDPAKRQRYDRALGLGAFGAARPSARDRARRAGEEAAGGRAESARRARDEAGRRRDDAHRADAASGPTRRQAARERLRARKTALAHAVAWLAGQELTDRVAVRVGFSLEGGWSMNATCSIRGPEDDGLVLGPNAEILEVLLTGASPRGARRANEGRSGAGLQRLLGAHDLYRAGPGPALGDPALLRPAGARWLVEAGAAFHAAVWAAACAARVRTSEADLLGAASEEERRRRRSRALDPIRRWLGTSPSAGPGPEVERLRADLERHARIVRREYAAQVLLLQKPCDPVLQGFFDQCLQLVHAAAECVAPYLSVSDAALASLVDERVAAVVDVPRDGCAPREAKAR